MAFDPRGRPPRELSYWNAQRGNTNVRPFSDFGILGTGDDTPVIQAAHDFSIETGTPVGGAGIFKLDGLVIKNGAKIHCPGPTACHFEPVISGSAAPAMFLLDSGPVQHVELYGFMCDALAAANAGQHCFYLLADPQLVGGTVQGGLWESRFGKIFIRGFTGEGIWLHGGDDDNDGPHQFISFRSVVVENASTTRRALRLTGQCGQIEFDAASRLDGPGLGVGTENILIERTVDPTTFANNGDRMGYAITFLGTTSQNCRRIARIERALSVAFEGCYFENAYEGILNDISAPGTSVRRSHFANVGHNPTNTGWALKNAGGSATITDADDNKFYGTVDTHYVRTGGELRIGRHSDDTGLRTSGVTKSAMAAASTLQVFGFNTLWVNGGAGSAVITTIDPATCMLPPGESLTIRANAGTLTIGAGGNINLGAYPAPLVVPQDGTITLIRNDLSGTWIVAGVSGPKSQRPMIVYINTSNSPYTVPAGCGTVNVDATSGPVAVVLAANTITPPGERVTVRKYDATVNAVTVSGANAPAQLTRGNQTMDFERNATIGSGDWSIVASHGMPGPFVKKLKAGSFVQIRNAATHAIIADWDGDSGIDCELTVTPQATAVAGSIAARDGAGALHATAFAGGPLHNNADTATAANTANALTGSAIVSGSSTDVHGVIAALASIGVNLIDATTP